MTVFGLAGWSGSGKTTLLARLLPELNRQGVRVSTVKHAHHGFDVDTPGKDSYIHRQSGAHEVMISSENRWVLMHENRGEAEPNLDQLIDRMADVDMVLIEGFKSYPHSKLEIHRASQEKPLICDGDPSIVAVASDAPLPDLAVPVLPLDDIAAIAAFILEHCGLAPALAETTS